MMDFTAVPLRGLQLLGGYLSYAVHAASNLRALRIGPVYSVFQKQLYFSGVQGLGLIVLLGLIAGVLIVTKTTTLAGGRSELAVKILDWLVIGELGPLLAAVILIARSGVAMATELALMAVQRETDTLESLHIPPLDYIVVPRVAALTLASVVLTIYFEAVAVIGGLGVSSFLQNASFVSRLLDFFDAVSFVEIVTSMIKSALFGMAIAVMACYHGLNVPPAITSVPVAATQAVIHGLMAVFAIDLVFAYLRFVLA